jgi:hypothetical protein
VIGLLIACYPARWRSRYGEEFAAVLESRPLGPFDAADVLLGALDAHLHLRGQGAAIVRERGVAMSLRIGGLAAIAGGLLWLFVSAASAGRWTVAGPLADIVLFAASGLLLVALAGLSAFQARRYPRLVWAAFTIPAGGAAIAIVSQIVHATLGDQPFVFGLGTWAVWMAGLLGMFTGSALFAAVTLRLRTLSRAAASVLLAGSLLIIPAMFGLAGLMAIPGELLLLAAVVVFSGGWIGIGASALRIGRPLPAATG